MCREKVLVVHLLKQMIYVNIYIFYLFIYLLQFEYTVNNVYLLFFVNCLSITLLLLVCINGKCLSAEQAVKFMKILLKMYALLHVFQRCPAGILPRLFLAPRPYV